MPIQNFDVLVIGGGPAGLAASIAFGRLGRRVAVMAPIPSLTQDGRTVAIMQGSLPFLNQLGIWDQVRHLASPLAKLRIIDDTDNLFRPPPATFNAAEIGFDAFGYNVAIPDLVTAFEDEVKTTSNITRFTEQAVNFSKSADGNILTLGDGKVISAPLLVGADGAKSPTREFAGIGAKAWDYPQTAITAILSHQRDHQDISTEFHTREGPFTLVPMPGLRSSLVWMMKPEKAEHLLQMEPESFTRAVEKQAYFMLGRMNLLSKRGSVPMRGLKVETAARNGVALVGEAAHVFPPIGAQGLNLGLRDVQSLADAVKSEASLDAALKYYASDRARDIGTRMQGVDLLNRSLIAGILPADFARGVGLVALQTLAPLRRIAMRAGMGLPFSLPGFPMTKRQ